MRHLNPDDDPNTDTEPPVSDDDTLAQLSKDERPADAATRFTAEVPVRELQNRKSEKVEASEATELARDSVSLVSEWGFLASHSAVTQVDTPGGWQLCRIVLTRLGGAAVVGLLLSIVAALFDTVQVVRATAEPSPFFRTWGSDVGLIAPLCLAFGLLGEAIAELLHCPDVPSWFRLMHWLQPVDTRRRARLAAMLVVAPVVCLTGSLALARVAVLCLSLPGPGNSIGALMAAAGSGLALLGVGVVVAVGRTLGVRLRRNPPNPAKFGLVGFAAGVGALLLLVALGSTSGSGSVFAIFGVFRRQELDLRAPALLLLLLLAGYASSWMFGLVGKWQRLTVVSAAIPLALLFYAARWGMNQRVVALSIERSSPLGKLMLSPLRRLTDRDKDGFSSAFGGGDCNDHNPLVNPGADDVPGNGVDEDCSGSDAKTLVTAPVTQTPKSGEWRALVPKSLNVVFLSIDTVRADVLNDSRPIVPRLRELERRGVAYVNAYSPASYTGKSVGPFIIGKHSSETNRDFSHFNAFKREHFLQQRLQDAGIRTISVQGYWYFYSAPYGFEKGFDVVDSAASPGQGYVEGDRTTNADKQADRVIAQLRNTENTAKQFYLWCHFTDPHAEYVKHAGFDFGSDAKGKYLGEIAFVDAQIGRILDAIAQSAFVDRTAIVVTSDHGEAFGEHGMYRHGFELWEPLIRVPLIFYVPGIAPRSISVRRSLIDLVPTILDLMGVPLPNGQDADFLSGQSLAPEMLSLEEIAAEPRPVFVDMSAGPNNAERQAYIENDLKLILSNGRPLGLYDISSDPDEKHDILDQVDKRAQIVERYKAFRRTLRPVRVAEVRPN